jgi:flavin-dependent dehydrogenase
MPRFDTDVLVIGGGPAGLAAALAARQRGFRVMVADGQRPPIDKACGEGLMPEAIRALKALGLGVPSTSGGIFRGIRFIGPDFAGQMVSAEADFPSGYALAVRRTLLHELLTGAVIRSGGDLLWDTTATSLTDDGAVLRGNHLSGFGLEERRVRCRWLVGADGFHSRVRAWSGLDRRMRNRERYGFRVHYQCAPWTDKVEVHWGREFQIYVTPSGAHEVCIGLLCRDPRLRVKDALAQLPELEGRLAGAPRTSAERGSVTAVRILWAVSQGNIALIGDASGSVDAITGDGLGLAFQQALALAEALEREDLVSYEAAHRRLARRPTFMSDFMLLMDGRPNLQAQVLQWLSGHPAIFRMLLAFHAGELGDSLRFLMGRAELAQRP